MPVYEYKCEVCGKRFEQHRRFGEPHPTTCPDGHEGVRRVFSPPSIVFKGSGFYATDHGSNGSRPERKSEKTTSETESSKTETPKTKESKTETVGDKA